MQETDSTGKLIIVCGLPGSGKTTHARQLEAKLRGLRLCPDEWMDALSIDIWDEARRAKIEAIQWELGQQFLALSGTVIIEWGTWGRSERDALRERARQLGVKVELHYLTAPVDVLFGRIQRRQLETPPGYSGAATAMGEGISGTDSSGRSSLRQRFETANLSVAPDPGRQ